MPTLSCDPAFEGETGSASRRKGIGSRPSGFVHVPSSTFPRVNRPVKIPVCFPLSSFSRSTTVFVPSMLPSIVSHCPTFTYIYRPESELSIFPSIIWIGYFPPMEPVNKQWKTSCAAALSPTKRTTHTSPIHQAETYLLILSPLRLLVIFPGKDLLRAV